MGSSESKIAVASTPKPEPGRVVQNRRLAQLVDPRSPSCGIDRTPIQVGGAATCVNEVQEAGAHICVDPRSPTPGVARTPMKDSMKVTVSSLARKLSTFFLNDIGTADAAPAPLPHVSFTKHPSLPSVEQQDELSSTEPLLPPHDLQDSLSGHKGSPSSPVACNPSVGYGSFCNSPFVLVGEIQVELDADAEVTLEEAEEALLLGESPLQRELSLSLLGCRDGVYSPEFYSSAKDRPATPLPPSDEKEHADHAYALPLVSSEPVQPSLPSQEAAVPPAEVVQMLEQERAVEEAAPSVIEEEPVQAEKAKLATPEPDKVSSKPSSTLNTQRGTGILIPRFDTRSPSQAVFKPQWLGVGFGATGVRTRGVQGRGKGTSSPLSSRKPAMDENENKVVLGKQKQRGKGLAEGRSPLQILREANSPRDHTAQMKLKVSTPEKQRFGQMDRRVIALSLNKENQ